MDRYPIRVTLLANAGVLIRYRDTALLLDGLFGRKDNPFSLLPPGCREAMLRAEPPFERLDYLLFTHYHPDHFDPEMVRALLERRRVKGLFYPKDESPAVQKLSRWLRQEGIPCVPLCRDTDRAAIQIEPDISVQAFMVPHLGEEYRAVPHVCYLLTFDGRRVLFTADSDYLHEDFSRLADTPCTRCSSIPCFTRLIIIHACFTGILTRIRCASTMSPFRRTTGCICRIWRGVCRVGRRTVGCGSCR